MPPALQAEEPTDWIPKAGDLLAGRYRVEGIVGSGGMAVVLSAVQLDLDRRVAIKLMPPRAAKSPITVERFVREARAASSIQSDHVVKVYEVGRLETGVPFLVMEFLVGVPLSQLLARRGLVPIAEGLDYVLQACVAVAHCHASGIVHRDLKPENIMVLENPGQRGHVKVLDFGISKVEWFETEHTPSLTGTTDVFGTPTHMSPEQVRSARSVDHRTDIWSLGVVLYEVATGRPPFIAESLPALAAMIVTDEPLAPSQFRPDLPPELSQLIMRCLAKRADQRPQNVQEIARELAPFTAPVTAPHIERIFAVATATPSSSAASSGPFSPLRITANAWGTTQGRRVSARRGLAVGVTVGLVLFCAVTLGLIIMARFDRSESGIEPIQPVAASEGVAASAVSKPALDRPAVEPQVPTATPSASAEPKVDAGPAPPARPAPARRESNSDALDNRF